MSGQATILSAIFFGSLGFGFFVYGKRQDQAVPLVAGLALIVLPYLVSKLWLLLLLGIALTLVPYWLRD